MSRYEYTETHGLVRFPDEITKSFNGYFTLNKFYENLFKIFIQKDSDPIEHMFLWDGTNEGIEFWEEAKRAKWEHFVGTEAYHKLLYCLENMYPKEEINLESVL